MLRKLLIHDLDEILRIQERCYSRSFIESPSALLSKILMFPEGAWGLFSSAGLSGYIICIPASGDNACPLGDETSSISDQSDRLYIHDLAVHPEHRSCHVGTQLVRQAESVAAYYGYNHLALVSVQETESFWINQGFESIYALEYGPEISAIYMTKII